MSEYSEQMPAAAEDVLLPEGWTEDEDLFAAEAEDGAAENAGPQENVPEEAPATGRRAAGSKLRFTARVDHEDREVELDENELPDLYQKAQATERAQRRLRELSALKEAGAERDLAAEAEELLTVFPQMRGRSIPTEVVLESLRGKKPLTAAFAAWSEKQHEAELAALRRENDRREAASRAASHAPVRGAAGGSVREKPADPFLSGFNAEF